jgi:8-oxo-dGTP pyrophosphatase MutT (NUDIX family)/phosphohistidine phosphatase SixA
LTSFDVLAAGAVLWRPTVDGRVEVALVHRPRYDDWSLPKGKLDPGETVPAAAVREVAEETGFACVLGRHLGAVEYRVPAGRKRVEYFAARAGDGAFAPDPSDDPPEVDELRWLAPEQAGELLSYPHDRAVLEKFRDSPHGTTTVLLVRHAKAGKRKDWHAADELRPLTDAGMRQAEALRTLLPLFGVDRVHSAPPLRCEQTVRGLADDLGWTVTSEPLLGEEGYWVDPSAGLSRFRDIAGNGGIPAVSSQGGVIPDLVSTLAEEAGLDVTEVPSRKGSVWVLSFDRNADGATPRLIAADYLDSPLAWETR